MPHQEALMVDTIFVVLRQAQRRLILPDLPNEGEGGCQIGKGATLQHGPWSHSLDLLLLFMG